jgi:hypothetical protein
VPRAAVSVDRMEGFECGKRTLTQTQPSWRPCMSVRMRMLTVDVVNAMSALSMVRIATRRILGFLNDDVKIGQTNSIVRKTLRKRS